MSGIVTVRDEILGAAFAEFTLGEEDQSSIPIAKTWENIENRTFIVEKVPWKKIGPEFQSISRVPCVRARGPVCYREIGKRLSAPLAQPQQAYSWPGIVATQVVLSAP